VLLAKLGPAEELLRDALEPPPPDRVADALDSLIRLGAIEGGGAGAVTPLGKAWPNMPEFPSRNCRQFEQSVIFLAFFWKVIRNYTSRHNAREFGV
jgi:hypothetical protein